MQSEWEYAVQEMHVEETIYKGPQNRYSQICFKYIDITAMKDSDKKSEI